MLSKQSIRGNVQVFIDNELATKDQLINLSKFWSDNEEILFRKMLKQGGKFKIQGKKFQVIPEEQLLNSRGNTDSAAKPMDHSGDDVDLNYLK